MKQFYFDTWSMDFEPQRECKKCPHRHNSLLASEGCNVNVLEKYVVYHSYLNKKQGYPTLQIAKDAFRVFCSIDYMFKRKGRDLTLSEKLTLSMKHSIVFRGNQCFLNGKLYAEIKEA